MKAVMRDAQAIIDGQSGLILVIQTGIEEHEDHADSGLSVANFARGVTPETIVGLLEIAKLDIIQQMQKSRIEINHKND